jgi:hypothetical protein
MHKFKHFLGFLLSKKALLVFVLMLVTLLPRAISTPAQMTKRTVLTEMTVSQSGDEYEISAVRAVGEKFENMGANGGSLAEILNKLGTEKRVSLSHMSKITIDPTVTGDLTVLLRPLYFRNDFNNNCRLAFGDAQKFGTVEKFFKQSRRFCGVATLPTANGTAVFLNGRYNKTLTPAQSDALSILLGTPPNDTIIYGGETIEIRKLDTKIAVSFANGAPVVRIKINLTMKLLNNPTMTGAEKAQLAGDIKAKIGADIADALAELGGVDILNLYDRFHKTNTARFRSYLARTTYAEFLSSATPMIFVNGKII